MGEQMKRNSTNKTNSKKNAERATINFGQGLTLHSRKKSQKRKKRSSN